MSCTELITHMNLMISAEVLSWIIVSFLSRGRWWHSPAGGCGVIHRVLIGLRGRLGSPRATRHRRSRGDAVLLTVNAASHKHAHCCHHTTDTSCISRTPHTSQLLKLSAALSLPCITPRKQYNAKNPLKNGNLYPTLKLFETTALTSPPFSTVIFINFHGLIIDQTLLLTFEHK